MQGISEMPTVYSDKYKTLSYFISENLEFEVLNELKDLSTRTDANCLYHTRFLFECDGTPLEEQEANARSLREDGIAVRAVYSGGKSVHTIIEFGQELEPHCGQFYKEIWAAMNEMFFNGKADKACANPARLTRRPNAVRASNGKRQTLLFDCPENAITKDSATWKRVWRCVRAHIAAKTVVHTANRQTASKRIKTHNDGMCAKYDVVLHYLRTDYPKLNGNGDSATSLFKAVRCCMKYGDNGTLLEILAKAKRERWTEKELNRILMNVEKYIS